MDDDTGTRPHFHVSGLLHGAMRDIAEFYDIDRGDAYVAAVMLFVTLDDEISYRPTSEDGDIQEVLDHLLENCYGEGASPS